MGGVWQLRETTALYHATLHHSHACDLTCVTLYHVTFTHSLIPALVIVTRAGYQGIRGRKGAGAQPWKVTALHHEGQRAGEKCTDENTGQVDENPRAGLIM